MTKLKGSALLIRKLDEMLSALKPEVVIKDCKADIRILQNGNQRVKISMLVVEDKELEQP